MSVLSIGNESLLHDYNRDLSRCYLIILLIEKSQTGIHCFRAIEDTLVLGHLIYCCIDSHDRAPFFALQQLGKDCMFLFIQNEECVSLCEPEPFYNEKCTEPIQPFNTQYSLLIKE